MAMSMDALTEATVRSLVSKVLPKLTERLVQILNTKPEQRNADDATSALINEAVELLHLLNSWTSNVEVGSTTTSIINSEATDEMSGEISDDAAMSMLQEMEAAIAPAAPTDEISDDDALSMLQEMDAPVASSAMDDLASELAAEIAAEVAKENSHPAKKAAVTATAEVAPAHPTEAPDGPMSDDEAMQLLMSMDGPTEEVQSAPTAPAAPAASAVPAGPMSDDEAMNLLMAMDEPTAEIKTEVPGVYENPNHGVPVATGASGSDDLDDETARMMAELEAQAVAPAMSAVAPSTPGVHTPPAASPQIPSVQSSQHDSDEDDEDANVGEINEWDENQFSSDPEMLKDFVTNTNDLMDQLDSTILQLEQDPTNKETIESIFRAAHTLKGAAGMFGYRGIERVMHRMENLFDLVRKGKLVPTADTIDVVFQGLDVLKKLLEAVAVSKKSGIPTAPIVRALSLAAKGKFSKNTGNAAPQSAPVPTAVGIQAAPVVPTFNASAPIVTKTVVPTGQATGGGGGNDGGSTKQKKEEQSTIRVDLERLDALVNLVGELVIDRTRFAAIEEELRTTAPQLKAGSNMTETVQLFGRHMNEIQDIIMKVRMVPIGNAFNKFPRVVRDLARQLGKQMDLLIDGEGTELDKTLVEQIADPLVHLIRNACDHGIEKPDERLRSGKPPTGRIILAAKQEGNHILISISDDGKGMSVEKIRAKGIERGLISADANHSDREIFNLIFESGFSTAEAVTTVSGRGVGMDVVRKQIAKLKGMVEINSTYGKGSTITIQLPLTLAIVESLLVNCRGETFAIPLSSVIESERIKPSDIQKVGDAEVIKLRNQILPIIHLSQTLELSKKAEKAWYSEERSHSEKRGRKQERLFVVVVGSANQRFGIVVDQLLNQQEMVIKPMGPIMRKTPCVAGGAVLGNGEVVLVLDVQDLIENFRTKARNHQIAS